MPIVVNGTGTVTGISVGGLPDGIVDTDMLAANAVATAKIHDDALTAAKMPAGSILQIVNTRVTAASSLSMNGNEFTNISVLNTSITPSSSSSKILVSMYSMGEGTDNDSNFITRVERDISGGTTGTRLGGVDSGSRLGCFQAVTEGHDSGNTGVTTTYIQFSNYLDSPSTTSACTYKLYIRNDSNRTWYINRTKDDTDHTNGERGHSYCTLMEVAG